MNICSPHNKYNDNICYPTSELHDFVIKILKFPNKKYTRNQLIQIIQKKIYISSDKWKLIWKHIFKCHDCHIPHANWQNTFLLSNFDIENVLQQYNSDSFYYCGYIEINDASNVIEKIQNIKKCGALVIYHPNDNNISIKKHWSCLWIHKQYMIHFDSENNMLDRNKHLFKIINKIRLIFPNIKKIIYNTVDIQLDNINCGLFVIDFVVNQIKNNNFENWINEYITMISNVNKENYIYILTNLRYKYFI
jgi:hypothetical protein